jgi:hypothetical protein
VQLIYALYKSLQLQHTQSLLFVILSSLLVARKLLLTMEIPNGQPKLHSPLATHDWLTVGRSGKSLLALASTVIFGS